ncbi:type II toxin-antitoxin system VapC family toxin [Roseibacillus ishigakijimensis]|uniref:Type II toxin-antitoxin system VapC family toxin n=1 Tax=Roseibacillus ishigakijimensis TaxID=454146 RepID=A0A934VNL4_9BACT|nr:type II toxin-antitoxin system VapC family toxin [Roseibacillus ishigakijimensis]MBK1835160.1 type II toxin-antitoxin system VapC family toxin [Roseibacillus ishigakijimensis]
MKLLVDTNVWIEHFQQRSAQLSHHLLEGEVFLHPLVFGELALGQFKQRELVLEFLAEMPQAQEVTAAETLALIEGRRLMGRGIGLVGAMLLGSALITEDCLLWTRDRRLAGIAEECGAGFLPGE